MFTYQTVFSARFHKQDEDDQLLDEIELYSNFNNNQILTESDIDKTDIRSQLQRQIQNQETIYSGWRFDKIN